MFTNARCFQCPLTGLWVVLADDAIDGRTFRLADGVDSKEAAEAQVAAINNN